MQYITYFLLLFVFSVNSLALSCDALSEFKEYGGKYYAISSKKLTWNAAKIIAENNGGYLAIPDDHNENQFLAKTFGGGWIGFYDPNYSNNYCNEGAVCTPNYNRFRTVKNEPITNKYKNFATGEPNNIIYQDDIIDGKAMVSPLGEHWVAMGQNGKWGDFGNHARENNNPIRMYALFEFDSKPECAPPTGVSEMDYSVKKCQTQVYDFTAGILSNGVIFDCLKDIYGNEYCPDSLAPCAQEWDYYDGWSTQEFGEVVDETSQVEECETTKPNVTGVYTDEWWNCDTCGSMPIDKLQETIRKAGGTGNTVVDVEERQSSKVYVRKNRGVLNDSATTIQVGVNDAYVNVGPGEIAAVLYKKVGNATTDTWKSAGGKPWIRLKASTQCSNWVWHPPVKKIPGHWYCADSGSNSSATCPAGYTQGTNDLGYAYCYNCYLTCPPGYSLNGNTCQKTISYSYYEYICKSDVNNQGFHWIPQETGGDCNGENLLPDGSCNSATPPKNKCKREKFLCQANNDRPCSYAVSYTHLTLPTKRIV